MRKTFNLPEDVIEYMKRHHAENMSAYITKLIREDMSGDALEARIERIVKKHMSPDSANQSITSSVMSILNG